MSHASPNRRSTGQRQQALARASGSALRIEYVSWGGHFKDARQRWCATETDTGEVWDYGQLEYLKRRAKAHFKSFVVMRLHRDGTKSIVESWPNNPAQTPEGPQAP